jgi:hypothetical protein
VRHTAPPGRCTTAARTGHSATIRIRMDAMDNPADVAETSDGPETANPVADKADVEQQQGAGWGQFLEAQPFGGDTSDETARLLLAAMDERYQAQDSGSDGSLSAMISRLVAATTNYHQCTVYFMTTEAKEDAEMRTKAPLLLAGSCVIVIAQCATVIAIFMGNFYPACASADFCKDGQTCNLDIKRCTNCGTEPPMTLQMNDAGETFNSMADPQFVGYNTTLAAELCADPVDTTGLNALGQNKPFSAKAVVAWCHSCFTVEHEGRSGSVDPMTGNMRATMLVDSMDQLDWAALFFSTVVVGFAVARELQDIEICTLTVSRASAGAQAGVRFAITLLNGVRRWVFLPNLLVDIAPLVCTQGADALSVCFNTVAVLFICEIDTVIYAGLPRRFKARMESVGRVVLTDEEADAMVNSQAVHVCAFVCMVLLTVTTRLVSAPLFMLAPTSAFFIGAAFEGFQNATSPAQGLCTAAKAFGLSLLGLITWFGIMLSVNKYNVN